MSSVQIRDVPDDVLAALKHRAAENRQSLQRYLLDVLTAEAEVARNADLLDDAASDVGGYPAAPGESAADLREARRAREAVGRGDRR